MKKLELKFGSIKEMLTKDQMKQISGGTSGCTVYADGGWDIGSEPCTGDICACQDYWDGECENSPECDDVDCGCK